MFGRGKSLKKLQLIKKNFKIIIITFHVALSQQSVVLHLYNSFELADK
jgi:hypothetical protein